MKHDQSYKIKKVPLFKVDPYMNGISYSDSFTLITFQT